MFYVRLLLIGLWIAACSVLAFPVILWDRHSLNYAYGWLFTWPMQWLCRIRVRVEGLENARTGRPAVYVANHQSGMDIMLFGTVCPRGAVLIGKRELLLIPFFGLFFVIGGNILIDRARRAKALFSLSKAVDAITKKGLSIWIFPEGTRNRGEPGMLPFKKGAFYLAIQSQVPIVSIVAGSLSDLISWKKRVIRPGEVTVRVLPPIETRGMTSADVDTLLARVQTQMRETFTAISPPGSVTVR